MRADRAKYGRIRELGAGWLALCVVGVLAGWPTGADAQRQEADAGEPTEAKEEGGDGRQPRTIDRSRRIEVPEFDAAFEKPSGWVEYGPEAGARVRLVAAGDDSAQLEIRVSDKIPADRGDSFFAAFHARIEQAGFLEERTEEGVSHGGSAMGKETEYRGKTGERKYRLVVWQHHHGDDAWIITAFFPSEGREFFYEGFTQLIASVTLQP